MKPHFIPLKVEVRERQETDPCGLKEETIIVEILFISSGNTTKITKEQIANYIVDKLIVMPE